MRTTTTAWVTEETMIEIERPYVHCYDDGTETRVPWVLRFDRVDLSVHIATRADLTKLRDALDAALADTDEAS